MENWLPIAGYEGLYEVSNYGRVRSLKRKTTSGKILAQKSGTGGYLCVCLCRENRKRTLVVHRLVANAYIPNPDNKPQVNHINGDRTDNRATNLEWVTQSENSVHSFRILGRKPTAYWKDKPRKFARRFTDEQIVEIRSDERSSREIAKDYKVSKTTIRNIKIRRIYKEI